MGRRLPGAGNGRVPLTPPGGLRPATHAEEWMMDTLGPTITLAELRYRYDAVRNEIRSAIDDNNWDRISDLAKRAVELKAEMDRLA